MSNDKQQQISSKTTYDKAEEVIDDLTMNEENKLLSLMKKDNSEIDKSKLEDLKNKLKKNTEEKKMAGKIIGIKTKALQIACIGLGQCGGNIAATMYGMGYTSIAINTTNSDLKLLNLPDQNKLLLEYGVGGASRELSIGREAAEIFKGEIKQLVNDKLANSQINMIATSLGGGSGSGATETMVEILSEIGKPIVVLCVLPMNSDDLIAKTNALETLGKLSALTRDKKVSSLLVVDNAKIEAIYSNVGQLDFFEHSNKAIVNVLDVFNTYSNQPSSVKSLDQAEFLQLLLNEGFGIFGELDVKNYEDETAIAEAVVSNLNGNLLSEGFDLKQAQSCGVMLLANRNVWNKIPSSSVNYCMSMINDITNDCKSFKGIYVVDEMADDVIKVYSFFGGLGLPTSRIEGLKTETKELQAKVKVKNDNRSMNITLDSGKTDTISNVEKIKQKIASKSSAFSKVMANGIIDRRK